MTTGQTEKYIAAVFSFGYRAGLSASNYLPFVGGTNPTAENSFIVPQNGILKNLSWDCDSNPATTGLTNGSRLIILIGNLHVSSSSPQNPANFLPITIPPANLTVDLQKPTTNGTALLNQPVTAGQRVAVYVQRIGGTIMRLRVSFELEVERQSTTWQLAANNSTVFYDGGNVGIGMTAPTEMLEVNGNIKMSGFKLAGGNAGNVLTSDASGNGTWQAPAAGWSLTGNANAGTGFLGTTDANPLSIGANNAARIRITPTGRIEFGDQLLNDASLQVFGAINFDGNGGRWVVNSVPGSIPTASDLIIRDSAQNAERFRIDTNGNVGIGTASPQARLDLIGSIRIADGTEGAGKVLTSDANGKGRWFTPASLPSGTAGQTLRHDGANWRADSNLYNDGTNVGINTNIPAGKFHVKGSADVSQLIVDASPAQSNTNPLIKLRKSDGTDLMGIHSDSPRNVFVGFDAGSSNNGVAGGNDNTFVGSKAGHFNTTGNLNTANGESALYSNTTGWGNTANGRCALLSNITGVQNAANGAHALIWNRTGHYNTAVGWSTLNTNQTGNNNTALGFRADVSVDNLTNATAIGANAKVATSNSLVLGGTGVDAVNVGIGTTAPTSKLQVVGLPVFPNNAAAIAGGLTAGAFYRTGGDPDFVCVVH